MGHSQLITGVDFKGMGYIPRSQRTTKPTTRTAKSSLLSLPPELRNNIYELVLLTTVPLPRFSASLSTRVPTLLHVNQQIRDEAISIYYGRAAIELLVHQRRLWHFTVWAESLDERARKYLLSNSEIKWRVYVDKKDKPYYDDKVRTILGDMRRRTRGWCVIDKKQKHLLLPINLGCNLERRQERPEEHTARMKKEAEKAAVI
ncbi:hypothetical protein LTR10_009991 [Elasticomyces elasticus]|nr:hypothetical protein LTR10_009991 [Elasticomyces elasticus]KAK4970283.1 hypothetical protein LTR42_008450 [Elasticomyces elasticus]